MSSEKDRMGGSAQNICCFGTTRHCQPSRPSFTGRCPAAAPRSHSPSLGLLPAAQNRGQQPLHSACMASLQPAMLVEEVLRLCDRGPSPAGFPLETTPAALVSSHLHVLGLAAR